MGLLITTTKKEFEEKVLQSKKTVLVDFWAEWCPPCRAMAPILEKVAEKLDKNVDVAKVNIEESAENNQLAGEYEVRSIPNMVIFKNGEEADRIIGLTQEGELTEKLKTISAK
jgi:thioredoxin 1